MTHRDSRRIRAPLGVLLAFSLVLSACREDEVETLPATTDSAPAAHATDDWLDPSSNEQPIAFLSRLTGEDPSDLAPLLELAARHYREGQRMIANRFGQLWQDLRVENPQITVAELLREFTSINPGPEESLGPRMQQYRVLRDQGLSHATAIAKLTEAGR